MERDEKEDKKMLDQALSAGDDWLRKQGVITDFSINTIIAWIYVNFQKVENVDMDVDRPNQQLYVRVYLRFWTLVFMTIFRQKDQFIDTIFAWLSEYLPTYELSVELRRWRGGKSEKFKVDSGSNDDAIVDDGLSEPPEGNIAQALRDRKNRANNPPNPEVPATQTEPQPEPATSEVNPIGSGNEPSGLETDSGNILPGVVSKT